MQILFEKDIDINIIAYCGKVCKMGEASAREYGKSDWKTEKVDS